MHKCENCKYKYDNETFGFAEYICVNAKSCNFREHIYSDYPNDCHAWKETEE